MALRAHPCLWYRRSPTNPWGWRRNFAAFDIDAPYELRALEVGLAHVTNTLDREVYELERGAYPTIGGWGERDAVEGRSGAVGGVGWDVVLVCGRAGGQADCEPATGGWGGG